MRRFVTIIGACLLSLVLVGSAWATYNNGVLLVDDDLSVLTSPSFPDISPKFVQALIDAGFTQVGPGETADRRGEFEIYEVTGMGDGPDLMKMQQYEAVIWFTGTTCCSTGCVSTCITENDEINLADYLDGGGNLFLSAQDYLERYPDGTVASGTFAYDYLKVAEVYSDVWQGPGYTAQGVSGSNTEGFVFELENPFGKADTTQDLWIDNLVKRSSKEQFYNEFYISTAPGGYPAISYDEGAQPTDCKVFFTTICFAALKDDDMGNTKGALMGKIMAWMLGDYADYGDAPDPPYYSRYENYGARHINSDGVLEWLGTNVDLEFNSWQPPLEDLYDDGVDFHKPYVPGEMGSVDLTITVSDWTSKRYNAGGPPPYGAGWNDSLFVHAWFDWNQNDSWDDAGENVFCGVVANPWDESWGGNSHLYTIYFPVPEWATNNDMWCRFRLDYHYNDNFYYNEHAYGEVEDYLLSHPLSVGLSTFYASAGDGQATLFWTTQSEVNNLGFYIQRSADGINYERINQDLISGHGTSEVRHDYFYVDRGLVNGVTYSYKVVDVDLAGVRTVHGPIQVTPQAVSQVPIEYALSQNYPNPFNAQTVISYAIPTDSHVSLKVFNVAGEEVRALVDADQQASTYQVTWDGRNASGKMVASGVYFCTLKAGEFSATNKMVFMK